MNRNGQREKNTNIHPLPPITYFTNINSKYMHVCVYVYVCWNMYCIRIQDKWSKLKSILKILRWYFKSIVEKYKFHRQNTKTKKKLKKTKLNKKDSKTWPWMDKWLNGKVTIYITRYLRLIYEYTIIYTQTYTYTV